jgi:hypothetical protein
MAAKIFDAGLAKYSQTLGRLNASERRRLAASLSTLLDAFDEVARP